MTSPGLVQPDLFLCGPDPVIGQPTLEFPAKWNKPERGRFGFHGFVTMKGGEYFFVPSISFFKNLK